MREYKEGEGFEPSQKKIYDEGYNSPSDGINPYKNIPSVRHQDLLKTQLWSAGNFDKWGRV